MRLFIKKLALFVAPFCIYGAFIVLTDPFDFLSHRSILSEETKLRTAARLNPFLWKMNKFRELACPNILLGDSRMGHVPTVEIKSITGEEYFDFSYGGATLREILDTFRFAAKHVRLHNVVVGINFNLYSQRSQADRTGAYDSMAANPFLYFLDRTVCKSALYGVYADYLHGDPAVGIPPMSREAFWKHQLEFAATLYRQYERPQTYKQELQQMTEYCRNNHIRCSFIILPTHADLQKMVQTARLDAEYEQFKKDIAGLGVTFDFDYPTELTSNARNFMDPFHFTDSVGAIVAREVWEDKPQYGRKLNGRLSSL